MNLIGLYSPAPGCGKTAVAQTLHDHGYARVPLAGALKGMACEFLTQIGYDRAEAERLVWLDKETVIPELRVSVRHILQTLGTEWGRSCIHSGVWIYAWSRACAQHELVVVDDVRFLNEAVEVEARGGQMWLITRPGVEDVSGHASEGGLERFKFDAVIHNDGSLADLRAKVLALL
jgi:hypothetical protein